MELTAYSAEDRRRISNAVRATEAGRGSEAATPNPRRPADPVQMVNVTGPAAAGEYPAKLAYWNAATSAYAYSDPVKFRPAGGSAPATDGTGYALARFSGPAADGATGLYVGVPAGGATSPPPPASAYLWPARITAGSVGYSWQRVYNSSSGEADDGTAPSSGSFNAYPVRFMGSAWPVQAGTRVLMWPAGSVFHFVPFPEATEVTPGAVNTGTQSLAGDKQLRGDLRIAQPAAAESAGTYPNPSPTSPTNSFVVSGPYPGGFKTLDMLAVYSSGSSSLAAVNVGGGVGYTNARGGDLGVGGAVRAAEVQVWGPAFRAYSPTVFTLAGHPGGPTGPAYTYTYATCDPIDGTTTSTKTVNYGGSLMVLAIPGVDSSPAAAPVFRYLTDADADSSIVTQFGNSRVDAYDGFAVRGRKGKTADITIGSDTHRFVKGLYMGTVPPP